MQASRATLRTWCGLAVLLLSALLSSMDISVLFVAGPAIAEALRPTATGWLWAMDIYGFVMAGLLITMGSLGDRIGRRRVLLIGAAVFGASSFVLAYAPNAELLILARAAMAIGGATLAPSTLSLIRGMFAHEGQRRTAVAAWSVAFAGGAIAGPIIGGALLEHFWWGSVFLINVPVMVLLLLVGPVLIAESRNPVRAPFDLLGAGMSMVAILSLVFAMKEFARHGLDLPVAGAAVLGLAAAAGFHAWQRAADHPLIDLALFRHRRFSVAIGASTVVALVMTGLGTLVFPFLQLVHGLSPLRSALWAVPTFATALVGAGLASTLAGRVAPARLLGVGLLVVAAGLVVVTTIEPSTRLFVFLSGYLVLTVGSGLTSTTATSLVLTTAPPERAGVASGIAETSTALGSSLGIATMGTVAAVVYHARSGSELFGATVDPSAYTDGLTTAAIIGAVLVVAVAAVTVFALREKEREAVGS